MMCDTCRARTPGRMHERCEQCRRDEDALRAYLARGGGAAIGTVRFILTQAEKEHAEKLAAIVPPPPPTPEELEAARERRHHGLAYRGRRR